MTRAAPESRVIPGVLSHAAHLGRRKPMQSVAVDESFRARSGATVVEDHCAANVLSALLRAALPLPRIAGSGLRLATSVLTDVAVLIGNVWLVSAALLQAGSNSSESRGDISSAFWLPLAVLHAALTTLLAYSEGMYDEELIPKPSQQNLAVVKTVFWATLLLIFAAHISGLFMAAWVLAAALPLNFLTLIGWRAWARHIAAQRIAEGRDGRNVLVVGAGWSGQAVASALRDNLGAGRVFRGFIVDAGSTGGDIVGTVADLAQVARQKFIDELILTSAIDRDLTRSIIHSARQNRLDVRIVPDLLGFELCGPMQVLGGIPTLTLHEESLPVFGLVVKRAVDCMIAAAGLVAISPILALVALMVKLDSPGPVFYCTPRVGKKGRLFSCWKFRTMVQDADEQKERLRASNQRQGPFFKMENDPRITRVGRFLRRYSLDELPQLWNVLKGDMSLVGPRPHPVDDYQRYELSHLRRLDMVPGLTGLWQITARGDPSFEWGMALDLEYIERWSLRLDLQILWKTLFVVLKGTGV